MAGTTMLMQRQRPIHLTYCTNAHAGETFAEVCGALSGPVRAVKEQVCPDAPFGVGLRLGDGASREIAREGEGKRFRERLDAWGLYVFTINGFPYGTFHGARVKENVYAPDWRTRERVDYTLRLIDLLAALLPEDVEGSISTLPGSFGAWIRSPADVSGMVAGLIDTVAQCVRTRRETGKRICLALEPEPFCFLSTSEDLFRFFEGPLLAEGRGLLARRLGMGAGEAESAIREHLGACVDTCHAAVQFEDLEAALEGYRARGIRVAKAQIGAAVEAAPSAEALPALARFADGVYLHQTAAKREDGTISLWADLPEALAALEGKRWEVARTHVHVPLTLDAMPPLRSTSHTLTDRFFARVCALASHIEAETYTFDVLPEGIDADPVEATARDLLWLRARVGGG